VHAARSGMTLSIAVLDIDHFKDFNDILGPGIGDRILLEVAGRIKGAVLDKDTVSRQGGDEFAILVNDCGGAAMVAVIAERILAALRHPLLLDSHKIDLTASIGISLFPDDATSVTELIQHADTALYQAKESGRSAYSFYTPALTLVANQRLAMEVRLRRALNQNEFVLHYQPLVNLESGLIVGVEALIRWLHPELGLIMPDRFIHIAEETGLILPIGDWVLRTACMQLAAWRGQGLPALRMAVNVTARQLNDVDFARRVMALLEETGTPPQQLEIEITESLLANDMEYVLDVLRQLKARGIWIAVDDFGTGYSSLSYLKRFPIDRLKIDQSFVRDLETDADDAAIVRAIVQMARSLNLDVLAEGVETQAIADGLHELSCELAQGWHFGRPMPDEAFRQRINVASS